MKIVHSFFLLLLFANLIVAQDRPIDVHNFEKEYDLIDLIDTTHLGSDILLIQAMTADDDYLYLYNDREVPLIKAFRISDGKYMGGFGTSGKGPGEFDGLNRSSFNARKGAILTHDSKHVRIFKVNESSEKLEFEKLVETRFPEDLGRVNQGFLVDDNFYAGSVMFTEKDFVGFKLPGLSSEVSGQSVENFGDYPDIYPEIPSTAYHHLYQGSSSYAFDGDALARYYSRVPLIRLFDLPSGEYKDIFFKPKHEQIEDLKPDPRGKSIQNGIEMFAYFSGVKIGRDFLVAQYEERAYKKVAMTERGNLESVPLTDKFLLVLNRDGELLAKLSPPDWMERFHVTPDNVLITFHPEVANQYYSLDLSQFN